ncbi:hypothetical protein M3A96_02780 [Helcobacillus massiliensis]|uniref:hypothetical protein n=1 Tax=Helcobacillus massiliensis TaxID=521392 RepID=UPI0021A73AC0|nr:hypothetical protein [Helcobacillus massiliensis]MCT1557053.1 hypothetical protein [Helcobacillus massiliensis]MCT2035442.1 hypothetical protein [Helcobacillus massiliensis]MCT2331343.1 hypothetical protein [Helcobacillus massiliensis]
MALRFNPPPNWPPAEPGWTPPEGWQPDPAWGEAPADWQYWVEDDADDSASHAGAAGSASETGSSATGSSAASAAPAPMFGAGDSEPSGATTQNWTPIQAQGVPEKKGFFARFWWLTCLVLPLLLAILAAIALSFYFFKGDDEATADPSPSPSSSSSAPADPTTTSEAPSPTETAEPTPKEPLVKPDKNAEKKSVVTFSGSGEVVLSTRWSDGSDIKTSDGEPVDKPTSGTYLVVTVQTTSKSGKIHQNPLNVRVNTPYGGVVDVARTSYSQSDEAGLNTLDYDLEEGESGTMRILYDIKKVPDLTITWNGDKSGAKWAVPEK